MQFICLIYSAENSGPQQGSDEFGPYMAAYGEFTKKLVADGKLKSGDALQPVSTATTVTMENGKMETMDGPFAETKEQLGGYYLIEAENLDEALEYAAMIPTATHGRVEVRPVVVWN